MMRRAVVAVIAVVVVSAGLLGAAWLAPSPPAPARADAIAPGQTGGQKVAFFESVTVGPGESWNNIVVIGGDLVVQGTVANGVVVIGGDVTVRSGASVGHSPNAHPDDAAIVCVFGKVTVEPGAAVSGRTVTVAGGHSAGIRSAFVDPVVRPWTLASVVVWILSTIFIAVVAVIVTAVAPRQVAYVSRRVRRHTLSSLGWGLLFLFVGVPLVTVVLLVTVIGIVVAVPWFFVGVPVALLFGYVSVGALIGLAVLARTENAGRGRVMVAAVIGVAILAVLRWVPFAGSLIVFLALVIGFGALFTAIWQWRGERRRQVGQPAGAGSGGAAPPAGPGYGGPSAAGLG